MYVMVTVPGKVDITTPDPVTEAIEILLEFHDPPAGMLPSVIVEPSHIVDGPVIAVGVALTVNDLVEEHPVGSVYERVTTPDANPLTTPVVISRDAIAVLLLVYIPPGGVQLCVTVDPTHTEPGLAVAAGVAYTVTSVAVMHPVPSV